MGRVIQCLFRAYLEREHEAVLIRHARELIAIAHHAMCQCGRNVSHHLLFDAKPVNAQGKGKLAAFMVVAAGT